MTFDQIQSCQGKVTVNLGKLLFTLEQTPAHSVRGHQKVVCKNAVGHRNILYPIPLAVQVVPQKPGVPCRFVLSGCLSSLLPFSALSPFLGVCSPLTPFLWGRITRTVLPIARVEMKCKVWMVTRRKKREREGRHWLTLDLKFGRSKFSSSCDLVMTVGWHWGATYVKRLLVSLTG